MFITLCINFQEGNEHAMKVSYSSETSKVNISRSPSVREHLGDWKTTTSTLQQLKERLNANKYVSILRKLHNQLTNSIALQLRMGLGFHHNCLPFFYPNSIKL